MTDNAVADAVSAFGRAASARLSSAAATGEPEDQLRGPFENLMQQLAGLCGFKPGAVGSELSFSDALPPDYTVRGRAYFTLQFTHTVGIHATQPEV